MAGRQQSISGICRTHGADGTASVHCFWGAAVYLCPGGKVAPEGLAERPGNLCPTCGTLPLQS